MGGEEVYKVTLMEEKDPSELKAATDPKELEAVADEEEAAGDMDDPFAMMGGMGGEEVYKVTLMEEKDPSELKAATDPKELEAVADEEEAAGDMDDPFAMMGGMGGEEVYKVTLMEEKDLSELKAATDPKELEAAADEEEAAGDMDDPFAMMGGMGGEEVYKVTLMK